MNSRDIPPTLIFNRFLFRSPLGRSLHVLINLCVILQFCSPQAQPTWAADTVVNALGLLQPEAALPPNISSLALLKNHPLGRTVVLDGHSLVPASDPNASFTWFGPFPTVTGPGFS